jgi:hypothetical protein
MQAYKSQQLSGDGELLGEETLEKACGAPADRRSVYPQRPQVTALPTGSER